MKKEINTLNDGLIDVSSLVLQALRELTYLQDACENNDVVKATGIQTIICDYLEKGIETECARSAPVKIRSIKG